MGYAAHAPGAAAAEAQGEAGEAARSPDEEGGDHQLAALLGGDVQNFEVDVIIVIIFDRLLPTSAWKKKYQLRPLGDQYPPYLTPPSPCPGSRPPPQRTGCRASMVPN